MGEQTIFRNLVTGMLDQVDQRKGSIYQAKVVCQQLGQWGFDKTDCFSEEGLYVMPGDCKVLKKYFHTTIELLEYYIATNSWDAPPFLFNDLGDELPFISEIKNTLKSAISPN